MPTKNTPDRFYATIALHEAVSPDRPLFGIMAMDEHDHSIDLEVAPANFDMACEILHTLKNPAYHGGWSYRQEDDTEAAYPGIMKPVHVVRKMHDDFSATVCDTPNLKNSSMIILDDEESIANFLSWANRCEGYGLNVFKGVPYTAMENRIVSATDPSSTLAIVDLHPTWEGRSSVITLARSVGSDGVANLLRYLNGDMVLGRHGKSPEALDSFTYEENTDGQTDYWTILDPNGSVVADVVVETDMQLLVDLLNRTNTEVQKYAITNGDF